MQSEISQIAPGYWAKTTGPDVPQAARGLLFYMASHCDLETGSVTVSHNTISRHFSRSHQLGGAKHRRTGVGRFDTEAQEAPLCGDGRVDTYTVAGAESGWEVTIPFVSFSRHGMYELHREIAHLQRLQGKNAGGSRMPCQEGNGSSTNS